MSPMNLGESIRHCAKWMLGGQIASQAIQFIVGVILARLLLPADFGTLVTVQIYTGLAGFLAGGGMGQALIRAKDAKLEDFQVVFTLQLATGILIYALFFIASPSFASWYNNPVYIDLLRVSAISFLLRPFSNVPTAWLIREMRFRQRVLIDLVLAPVTSAVPIILAWQHFGVWSLVIGGLASMAVTIVALFIVTPFRPAARFNAALTKELALYSFKVTSNDIVSYIRGQTPNFILGRLQGPAIVGLFNKADSLAKMPSLVSGSIYDSVFRGLAKTQDDKDTSRYLYFRTITLLTVYMLPMYVGLTWLAEPFVRFVYGANWLQSATPLSILSLGGVFVCIGHPSGAVLAAHNWLGREIVIQAITLALVAIACVVGIHWGLVGVSWGLLAAWAYSTLHMNWLASRCIGAKFKELFLSLGPGALLNAILCIALFLIDQLVPPHLREQVPVVYLLLMSAGGATVFALCFLFLPIPALASESAKWRKALRRVHQ